MKNLFRVLITFLFLNSLNISSQGESWNWYFGANAGITFPAGGPPVAVTNGQINTIEGVASISSPAGNLLFYTDGSTVWNKLHLVMANGTGLLGNGSSTQSGVIVPRPGNPNIYYIFTENTITGGLRYSEVDMSLAAGNGSVTVKNIFLFGNNTERCCAVRHCNKVDVWVITHDYNTNQFRTYLVTSAGVNTTPILQSIGAVNGGNGIGYLKSSFDGQKIAYASYTTGPFEIFDFNNSTAAISNPINIPANTQTNGAYGVEFSPDNSKLYFGNFNTNTIWQMNMCAGSSAAIVASMVQVGTSGGNVGSLQMGPDKKIYVARYPNPWLGVINNPNTLGTGCNYVDNGVGLSGKLSQAGLPNFIASYFQQPPPPITSTVVCLNASFTSPTVNVTSCAASANAISSYSWNFGDPGSGPANVSTIANPSHAYSAAGNYTATLILFYPCGSDTLKKAVSVISCSPQVTAYGGTICAGSCTTVNAIASGGTPPYTYTWTPNIGSTAGPFTVCPTVTTVYTVTAKDANNIIVSNTTTVFVNPTPTLIIGSNSPVCVGGTLNLTSSGATTYTWSGPNAFASNLQNPNINTVTLAMGGTYSLTGSIGTCTSATTLSVTVNALPQPTASSNSPICTGVTLNLNSGGAATYTWTGPNTFNSQNQNPSISNAGAANSGIYTVSVTDANGCKNFTTTTVTVNPTPTLSATGSSICVGQTMTLSASSFPGAGYAWTGPNGFVSIGQTTTVASAQATMSGVYNVTITSAGGCTNTASANVSIAALPNTVILNNTPVCAGGALSFTATGGTSYSWSGPNNFNSVSANPVINNVTTNANGLYSVIITANTCSVTVTTTIAINPLPNAIAGVNGPVCETKTLNLTGAGGVTYTWTGPANFSSNLQNPVISNAFVNNAGVYSLTVIDANGCQNTGTLAVVVNANPSVLASGATVCFGYAATLTAVGGAIYSWTGPNGFSSVQQNAVIPVVNNNTSGNYSVAVTGTNLCTSSSAVVVGTYTLPVPTITSTAKTCINTAVNLQGTPGFLLYQWTGPNNFLSPNAITSFTPYSTAQSGMYTLSVTDNRGCVGSTSTLITLDPAANAAITLDNNKKCIPFCSNFSLENVQGSAAVVSGNWSFNGQSFSGPTLNYCLTNAGDYLINANFIDANGCPGSATSTINAYPIPTAIFEFTPAKPIEALDEVKFYDGSKGAGINNWNWHFIDNDGFHSNLQNPTYTFEKTGAYAIALIVTNQWGCADTTLRSITVGESSSFYVPNTFTPNDDGINDIFFVKGYNVLKYEMSIFDRWGQKLFYSNDMINGWDGTFKGAACKEDVYVWKVSVLMPDTKLKTYTGHVTLNR